MKSKISISKLGGYHPNPELCSWPSGSIFEVEGERLYKLVKDLKPEIVVEVGTYYGCSTAWIAKALRDNKKGKVITIDNGANGGHIENIPDSLLNRIEFVHENVEDLPPMDDVDILFDDGPKILNLYKDNFKKFKPSMAYVVHDYKHFIQGKIVKPMFNDLVGEPDEVFFEPPTDCGLAIKFF